MSQTDVDTSDRARSATSSHDSTECNGNAASSDTDKPENVSRCQGNSSAATSGTVSDAAEAQPIPAKPAASEFRSPSKAGDPNFVAEFYSHSRLHHLSTWGAEFKAYVNKLQSVGDSSFPGRDELRKIVASHMAPRALAARAGRPERVIMHIDMDCFFVSVGLRGRPSLVGKGIHSVRECESSLVLSSDLSMPVFDPMNMMNR